MPGSESHPAERHRIRKSGGMHRQGVLVAFGDEDEPPLPYRLPRQVQRIKHPALAIDRTGRRVDILGSLLPIRPPAGRKRHQPSLLVPDREDQPRPHLPVIRRHFRRSDPHPEKAVRLPQSLVFRHVRLQQGGEQTIGGANRPNGQLRIDNRQLVVTVFICRFVRGTGCPLSVRPFLLPFIIVYCPLPTVNRIPFRQFSHRFRKRTSLDLLHESEQVSAFAASETFEKLFSRMDVQRRMLVCMERTQADISRTAALQRHIGSHHFLDRGHPKDSLFQRIASHNNRFS